MITIILAEEEPLQIDTDLLSDKNFCLAQARSKGRGRGGLSPPRILEVKKQCAKKYIIKTKKMCTDQSV